MPEVKKHQNGAPTTENSSTKKDDKNKIDKVMLNIKVDDCRETRTVGNCQVSCILGFMVVTQYKMTQDNIEENIRL